MNRYDHLIQEYLQQNKKVSLEKIGEFTLSGEPLVVENNTISGQYKINFRYDKRIETSAELIESVAKALNKNKNLVAADIESYLLETRQWINISKTYVMEGLGEINMGNTGVLTFNQLAQLSPKEEESRRKYAQPKETYNENRGSKKGGVFAFAVIIILIILGGIGWFGYNYFFNGKKGAEASNVQTGTPAVDTSLNKIPDTTAIIPASDSLTASAAQKATPATDSGRYKFIYEVTLNKERALSRTEQLKNFGKNASYDSITGGSFIRYRLFIDQTVAASDTTAVKDSLAKYLQRTILIKKY